MLDDAYLHLPRPKIPQISISSQHENLHLAMHKRYLTESLGEVSSLSLSHKPRFFEN